MRPKNNSDQRTLSAFHHLMNSTSAGNLMSNNKDFMTTSRNNNNNTDLNFHTITSNSSLMMKMKS